jgi:SAM-dependent methyltransferase
MNRCKVCDRSSVVTIKKYSVYRGISKLWDDVMEVVGVNSLMIRLGFCLHCGFVSYRDFFSFREMKAIYVTEARCKNKRKKGCRKENEEHSRMVAFLQKNLPKDSVRSVIDVGAGDFQALLRVRSLYPGATYEAIDPSYGGNEYQGILLHRDMLENFHLPRRFDLTLLVHVLEHIGNTGVFLRKIRDLVNVGKYLYVEVPFQVGPGLWLNRSVSPHHINYFSPVTVRRILVRYGFQIIATEFDKNAYLYNGMPGMLRVLSRKVEQTSQHRTMRHSGFLENAYYLMSPLIYLSTVGIRRLKVLLRRS